ncbi:MAG TPA: sigma-70 family RNA polymerase sigma factor [Chroococcales cyanobacterium]|jgi:RNA polymerase sporulation-specific sigma factor
MQRILYQALGDEELIKKAQAGDSRAESHLLLRYRPLVKQRILSYYLLGAEKDDLFQEGMIGLHKAVRDFDPLRATSFKHFAALCVLRQILTAVKAANRQKHSPLLGYSPLSTDGEEIEGTLSSDPDDEILKKEGVEWIKEILSKHLSRFEWQVFALYLKGLSYEEISKNLHRNSKAIDNALTRIREKGRGLRIQTMLP